MKRILEKSSDQDLVDSGKYVLNELMSTLEFQYVTKLDNSTFRKTKNPTDVKGKLGWESIRSSPRDGFGDLGFMLKMVDYPRSFLLLSTRGQEGQEGQEGQVGQEGQEGQEGQDSKRSRGSARSRSKINEDISLDLRQI